MCFLIIYFCWLIFEVRDRLVNLVFKLSILKDIWIMILKLNYIVRSFVIFINLIDMINNI